MTKTSTGLAAHARAQVGAFYWYGTFGQRPTLELLDQKRGQYPNQMTAARRDYAKKHHVGKQKRVFDCAGLVKSYWYMDGPDGSPKYSAAYDKSAAGLKACCSAKGPISTIPRGEAGLLVFIGTTHVGICDGEGNVIEARGFDHGVVVRPLSAGKWNAWGRLSWLAPPGLPPSKEGGLTPAPQKPATAPQKAPASTSTQSSPKKGDTVILNGPVFRDSYGCGKGRTFKDHRCTITLDAPPTRAAPFHVADGTGDLGWVRAGDIRKAEG